MIKLESAKYEPIFDDDFNLQEATNEACYKGQDEKLRNKLWVWDWGDDQFFTIYTYDELWNDFKNWDYETKCEFFQGKPDETYTAPELVWDCRCSLWPVSGYRKINGEEN